VTLNTYPEEQFIMPALVLITINLHTKFHIASLLLDIIGSLKFRKYPKI